ncbi:MAG: NADH-quinone oxidoreductase subunit M, partial [Bacteroidota bacterium]
IIFGAVYMLWLYQRSMFGKLNPTINVFADLNLSEQLMLTVITIVIFWMGLFPSSLLHIAAPVLNQILKTY